MAVAGLGLECRLGANDEENDLETISHLTRNNRCRGAELISCDVVSSHILDCVS